MASECDVSNVSLLDLDGMLSYLLSKFARAVLLRGHNSARNMYVNFLPPRQRKEKVPLVLIKDNNYKINLSLWYTGYFGIQSRPNNTKKVN